MELERALLARDDLPAGWSTYDEDAFPPPCDQAPALEADAERLVQENFGEGDFGPFVRHMVASYAKGDAVPAMERTRRQFLECGEWAGSFNGQRFTFRVSETEFPAVGEQSFALRLRADGPLFLKAESLLVFARRGDAAFLVAHTAAGFGGASVDRQLTERLVRRADERLQQVLARR